MPSLCHTVLFNKQRKCHNLVCLVHSLFYCLVFCIKTASKILCLVPHCIYKAPNGPLQTLSCTPGWSQCLTSPHSGSSCSHQGLTHPSGPQFASPVSPVAQDRSVVYQLYILGTLTHRSLYPAPSHLPDPLRLWGSDTFIAGTDRFWGLTHELMSPHPHCSLPQVWAQGRLFFQLHSARMS